MGKALKNIRQTTNIGPLCRERFLPLRGQARHPLENMDVNLAGISDLAGAYSMGRPGVHFHLALYTLGGKGRLHANDSTRLLKAGDLLVAPAGSHYGYELHGPSWKILWFHFKETCTWLDTTPGELSVRRAQELEGLERAMEGWLHEDARARLGALQAVRYHAELIALYLRRELAPSRDRGARETHERLHRVWEEVGAHLPRHWTVADLAQLAHWSPVHFHRQCRQQHRVSPMKMVTRLRMQRAEQLLRATAYPLKVIAELVGYENVFAFSTAFKRHAGKSPRAFRQARA